MNKKVVSALVATTMLLSATAQAAVNLADYFSTKSEYTDVLNNTEIKSKISTKVKLSKDTDYALHATEGTALITDTQNKVFDYEATLDMSAVKTAFEGYKAGAEFVLSNDTSAPDASQINASTVKGEFKVTIAYDDELTHSITANDIKLKQGTDGMFVLDETESKLDANPAEVVFKLKDDTTVTELAADSSKALGDISVELKNITASQNDKYLKVTVNMDGTTDIYDGTDGTSKKYASIKYSTDEQSDNMAVVIAKTRTSGGNGSLGGDAVIAPKAYTVVDGKTDAIAVKTESGVSTVDLGAVEEPKKDGFAFDGWYYDKELTKPADNGVITIKETTYFYAKFTPVGEVNVYVVMDGTEEKQELTEEDGKKTFDVDSLEDPVKEGFAFNGWYTNPYFTEKAEGVLEITEDVYLYPQFINVVVPDKLISGEHINYIMGYPDGEVKPNNNITREEVVAAFYRLLDEDYRKQITVDENSFADVEKERWSNVSVSSMAKAEIVVGDDLGNFNPSNPITRAEFAVVASKFAGVNSKPAMNIFSDIDGHWAKDAILTAVSQGWITGYEDGSFKPNAKITRAEAMTIINKMLVRYADLDSEYAKQWPDVSKDDWFYGAVIEATTYNLYVRGEDGWSETWTGNVE